MGVPGGGGGGNFGTCRAKSEKVGQICFRPPNFFLPVRSCSRQACSSKRKDGEKQTECALTSAIKLQIRERGRLKRLAINFNSEDYWNAYKISTNKTTDVLRKAKTNYYKRQFEKIRDDPKKPWETVNKILNR